MKSYRELEIYIESKRLAIAVYKIRLTLPNYELFEEGGQIRRSSKSITAMIVEGYCRRRYKPEFIKHLVYAKSECDETLLHLDFLHQTESLQNKEEYERLQKEYDVLSKKINKFISGLKKTGTISPK